MIIQASQQHLLLASIYKVYRKRIDNNQCKGLVETSFQVELIGLTGIHKTLLIDLLYRYYNFKSIYSYYYYFSFEKFTFFHTNNQNYYDRHFCVTASRKKINFNTVERNSFWLRNLKRRTSDIISDDSKRLVGICWNKMYTQSDKIDDFYPIKSYTIITEHFLL